jgi:hypothetical protein
MHRLGDDKKLCCHQRPCARCYVAAARARSGGILARRGIKRPKHQPSSYFQFLVKAPYHLAFPSRIFGLGDPDTAPNDAGSACSRRAESRSRAENAEGGQWRKQGEQRAWA